MAMNPEGLAPGAIVLVVGAFSCTGNIGREVTLELWLPPFAEVFHCDGYWEAGPEGMWLVGADQLERNTEDGIILSGIAAHIPRHLRLLRPPQVVTRSTEALAV